MVTNLPHCANVFGKALHMGILTNYTFSFSSGGGMCPLLPWPLVTLLD